MVGWILAGCAARAPVGAVPFELRAGMAVVDGTAGSEPVRVVIDTGAPFTVVTTGKVGTARRASVAVGSTGGGAARIRRLTDVAIALHDSSEGADPRRPWGPLAFRSAAELPLGDHLGGMDLIISPQHLASPGREVVIDLRGRGFAVTNPAHSGRALAGLVEMHGLEATVCRWRRHGLTAVTWQIGAVVGGHPVRLKVDTGAAGLVVATDSAAGQALAALPGSTVQIGGAFATAAAHTVDGVEVTVGSSTQTRTVSVLDATTDPDDPACRVDGLLGMGVLGRCVLVLGRHRLRLACDQNPT